MTQVPTLNGQFGNFTGALGSSNLLSKLRRTYVVVVSPNAPQSEKDNADAITSYLMQKLNYARVVTADDPKLDQLSRLANIILVGGPSSNEWAFKLNDFVNPKWDITVLKERQEGQSWVDYIVDGSLQVSGYIINEAKAAGGEHTAILGKGQNTSYPRLRPLQVVTLGGWLGDDTLSIIKAFLEDQEAGVYDTPTDVSYNIKIPVAVPAA